MKQKDTDAPIQNEAANGLKNEAYTIAMARTGDPHSATAQFFINVVNNEFLNHTAPSGQGWGYAVFGKVSRAKRLWMPSKKCAPHARATTMTCPLTLWSSTKQSRCKPAAPIGPASCL